MSRFGYGVMAGVLALVVGCSDSSDDTTEQDDKEIKVEVAVTAAEGGTVELANATLAIPANSLGADTVITATAKAPASALPSQSTLRGKQFVFGPTGTTFNPAATLTLPLPAGTSGKGTPVISWLDESTGTWVDLATTTTGTEIAAPVEHFTTFIVRFLGEEPITCDDAACGGDPVGSWRLVGGCVTKDPFDGACPGATVAGVLDGSSGTLTVNADHTFNFVATIQGNYEMNIPASCFAGKGATSCGDVGAELKGTCTGNVAVSCDCTIPISDDISASGTANPDGDNLYITTEDDPDTDVVPFCAKSESLWLQADPTFSLKFVPNVAE